MLLLAVVFPWLCLVTTQDAPGGRGFPHVRVDAQAREVRVECQSIFVEAPLEFFCVVSGTSEHESVLRTPAKPSHVHAALLMIGLEPGSPIRWSEAAGKWFAPHGPPVRVEVEFSRNGETVRMPAEKLLRRLDTGATMPATNWVFAGSRVMEDGRYGADFTGQLVSIVNFDLSVLDLGELASSANEMLQWTLNTEQAPPRGAPVTMILSAVAAGEGATTAPATGPSAVSEFAGEHAMRLDALRARWMQNVRPHAQALREAAQAQYDVIRELRARQQQLVDEADRVQRLIDELEREYQQMTTPQPR
jgi:hypothetical protein